MTFRFRRKILHILIVVSCAFLDYCASFESHFSGNTTDLVFLGNDSNNNVVIDSHQNVEMPDTTLLNTTFYNVQNQNGNDNLDLISVDSNSLQNLSLVFSLKIIHDISNKLSNVKCTKDISYVFHSATKREKWALEMIDSFPKFPESILYGNYYQLGNFDECVRVHKEVKMFSTNGSVAENTIKGQYCLADIYFKRKADNVQKRRDTGNMALERNRASFNNSVIYWAICLPSTCTTKDVEIMTSEVFTSSAQNFEIISVNVDPKKCETEKSLPITTEEIIYGIIVGLFLIFTLLATVLHCWYLHTIRKSAIYNVDTLREKQQNRMKETLICFSLINTTERFFHTKPNDLNLESICGIKFLSMVLIIAGHSLIFFFGGPIANTNFFLEVATQVENTLFINGPIIVDTFLLISGFLMCRLLLIEMDKRKGKINFLIIYIARYIRLTPAYAVVLGLYTTYLYRMGSGPFWESKIGLEKERCQQSWWLNLIYINNYVGTNNLCMFQSWYLAVDYHLFMLAPIVIYPLWKKPKLGVSILLLFTILSIILPLAITYHDALDPTVLAYPPEVGDLATNFYFVNYYIKTHMRCSSYCIGLFYAYLVHKIQRDSKKIPTCVITLGWIFAIVCGTASMFSIVVFFEPNHSPNIIENALYSAFHRVGWALSIGWILLVCVTDNAGLLNKFLSHKFFIPASRLTYCAYLSNGLVEIYSAGVTRQSTYMSIFELSYKTCGHIILTFTLAFVLCIIFESPIHGMEKVLLKSFDKKDHHSKRADRNAEEL